MTKISYKVLEKKQEFLIKVYSILCLFLVLGFGWYFWGQWQEYSFAKEGIDDGGELVAQLQDSVLSVKDNFSSKIVEFEALDKEIVNKLSTIFPMDDDYTVLTRQVDGIEQELAKKHDPFEISNISFQTITEDENYKILPLRMNIRSSESNFTKFLHKIENSGGLNESLRLMDVSSIRLNFEEDEIINFSVQINAYFQK